MGKLNTFAVEREVTRLAGVGSAVVDGAIEGGSAIAEGHCFGFSECLRGRGDFNLNFVLASTFAAPVHFLNRILNSVPTSDYKDDCE